MDRTALLLTIDVEEDMPNWTVERETTVHNAAALPRLQALCDEFGIRPTYLVTWPMATRLESANVLRALHAAGRCEIGAHLHVWNTPPLPDGLELEARRATQIHRSLMAARLETLTRTLEHSFGVAPRVFRSGRFGFDGPCLQELERLGYTVDTSITPGLSWRDEGGEDFRHAPHAPYFPDRNDPCQPGSSSLLEVPVSVGFTRRIPPAMKAAYHRIPRWTRLRGLLSRDVSRLLDFYWLSPTERSGDDLVHLADALIAQGHPVLNVFFHSSELFPGASIYARTEADVDRYFRTLRRLFKHLIDRRHAWSGTLSELRTAWVGPRPTPRGAATLGPRPVPMSSPIPPAAGIIAPGIQPRPRAAP